MSEGKPLMSTEPLSVHREQNSSGTIRTVLIAHRGGAEMGPENTCLAVIQSSFYRPDFYEIDIRHTKDGVAVCLHDETLDRTTELSGAISEITYEELRNALDEIRNADADAWVSSTWQDEPVPTFERIADCVNPSGLAIELKEGDITIGQCEVMLEALIERRDISSVVMSFHESALETWREAELNVVRKFPTRTVLLTLEFDESVLTGEHEVVGLMKDSCTEEIVEEIHRAGKAVWVWTVNDNYLKFLEMKVDGIVTDSPDKLRRAVPPG